MIPKFLIQLHNKLHNSNNTSSSKISLDGYKIFSKRVSYILLRLYEYPDKEFTLSKKAHTIKLYNDSVVLERLGLIKKSGQQQQLYLTHKGINFIQNEFFFSKTSVKLFVKMYKYKYIFPILDVSWIKLFLITLIPIIIFMHITPNMLLLYSVLWGLSYLLLIIISIIVALNSRKYNFVCTNLLYRKINV